MGVKVNSPKTMPASVSYKSTLTKGKSLLSVFATSIISSYFLGFFASKESTHLFKTEMPLNFFVAEEAIGAVFCSAGNRKATNDISS